MFKAHLTDEHIRHPAPARKQQMQVDCGHPVGLVDLQVAPDQPVAYYKAYLAVTFGFSCIGMVLLAHNPSPVGCHARVRVCAGSAGACCFNCTASSF